MWQVSAQLVLRQSKLGGMTSSRADLWDIANKPQKCQTTGWLHKGHKADCKVLKDNDVRGIFNLDWERFDGFVQFPL